jgi:3-hydroxyacyl-CoA dehydrogenase
MINAGKVKPGHLSNCLTATMLRSAQPDLDDNVILHEELDVSTRFDCDFKAGVAETSPCSTKSAAPVTDR